MTEQAAPGRKKKHVVCPQCWGSVVYYRVKTETYLCRTCGRTFRKLLRVKRPEKKTTGGIKK